jgi:hypothetical protein
MLMLHRFGSRVKTGSSADACGEIRFA